MKKLFSILFLSFLLISCECNGTKANYILTEQEKNIVPYKLNDIIKWEGHNNTFYNGELTEIINNYTEDNTDCNAIRFYRLIHTIDFNYFRYTISIQKKNDTEINLMIKEIIDDKATKSFSKAISLNNFSTIQFNGETYENAVLLKQKVTNGLPFGHLVYSKTNGIECILFADGTWYKRVE